MREILFRGKRKDNGEWIYGDLQQNDGAVKIREQEKGIDHIAKSFIVDTETVGQSSEVRDDNGRLIFEGDILKVRRGGLEEFYTVGFEHGAFFLYSKNGITVDLTLWTAWCNDLIMKIITTKWEDLE